MQRNLVDAIPPPKLGRRLQEARKARGLTQQAVADSLGFARTSVTALEKGERRTPSGAWRRAAPELEKCS